MKKSLFIILPALMALSACGAKPAQPVEKHENEFAKAIVEETLAQEEVFGKAEKSEEPFVHKLPVIGSDTAYKIGYQIHYDGTADTMAIRFIAAINAEYSTMIWSRGVTSGLGGSTIGFGNERYGSDQKLASTVLYTSLSNGGEDVITAGSGAFEGFNKFIVYSMKNIPYTANVDTYLGVMLTLHPAEGDDIVTPVYAVKVEKNGAGTASAHTFSFPNDKNGYFLDGVINGSDRELDEDNPARDGNTATFTTNLVNGDEFLVVQKTSTSFIVWNGSRLDGANADKYLKDDDAFVSLQDGKAGNYRFYLNSDRIYISDPCANNTGTSYYLRGGMSITDWDDKEKMYELKTNGDWNNIGVALNIPINANEEFKIAVNNSWNTQWNYWGYQINSEEHWRGSGISNVIGGAKANFTGGGDNNIKCTVTGTYNIYLTDLNYISIELAA